MSSLDSPYPPSDKQCCGGFVSLQLCTIKLWSVVYRQSSWANGAFHVPLALTLGPLPSLISNLSFPSAGFLAQGECVLVLTGREGFQALVRHLVAVSQAVCLLAESELLSISLVTVTQGSHNPTMNCVFILRVPGSCHSLPYSPSPKFYLHKLLPITLE